MNLKEKTVVIDNKTYRYSKIVMLECDKSFIYLHCGKLYNNRTTMHITDGKQLPQHLYFLSTDKICEGDWFIYHVEGIGYCLKQIQRKAETADIFTTDGCLVNINDSVYKVISSTDSSLNLPKPSEQFLQVYIDSFNKNEKIEECCVEYKYVCARCYSDDTHECWSAKECSDGKYDHLVLKVTKGEITIRKVKDSYSREEVEQLLHKCWLQATAKTLEPLSEYGFKTFIEQNL